MTLFKQIDPAVQNLIREATKRIILPAFYEQIADSLIRIKTDHSIVTQIDFDVQEYMQKELQTLLPQSGFLGEEETDYAAPLEENGDWLWIIDPIDGTHNFAAQSPDFGTMVALWHLPSHRPVYGWIYMPLRDVMFSGGLDEGVFQNGVSLTSESTLQKKLKEMIGLLNYGSFGLAKEAMQQNSQHFHTIDPSSCAAVKFVALFQDKADFAVFGRAKIWDLSAGVALLQEMGGQAARVNGINSESYGLSIDNPKAYPGWLLVVRHKENWPEIRDQLFENISL